MSGIKVSDLLWIGATGAGDFYCMRFSRLWLPALIKYWRPLFSLRRSCGVIAASDWLFLTDLSTV